MITTKPYFYDSFKCTADKCRDSCCIGWEIDIDSDTLFRYKAAEGELGEKLRNNIDDKSFMLTADERCPFLKKNGLCEIICEKGEGYLCEICREHPRYHEWYGNYHDVGLGLCCEEACRLIFSNEEPLRFVTEDDGDRIADDDKLIELSLGKRQSIYNILSCRDIPLSERFQQFCDCDSLMTYETIILSADMLEPFDDRWTHSYEYIRENIFDLLHLTDDFLECIGSRVYEYESLALYLLHRYYMKAYSFDSTYLPSEILRGIAAYIGIQYLFDLYIFKTKGRFDFSDRIDSAKYISKQIEYSEFNIDIIMNT